jgi:hypothetical protein
MHYRLPIVGVFDTQANYQPHVAELPEKFIFQKL